MKNNSVILIDNTKKILSRLEKVQAVRMEDTLSFLEKKWKGKIAKGTRTGRRYKKPGTKNTYYTASAPGEPPAAVLLDLIRSIRHKIGSKFGEIYGLIGSTLDKSIFLEFGTRKISKRPSLKPVFDDNKTEIKRKLSKRWL